PRRSRRPRWRTGAGFAPRGSGCSRASLPCSCSLPGEPRSGTADSARRTGSQPASSPASRASRGTWPVGVPELPEMEAWRRQLDEPVSALPIEKAGPAHIATLKTFDPPLATLEGRRLAGAKRRAKRLLLPTEDGERVLMVHLMTSGRLKYLRADEKGPKAPAFRLRFQ